MHKAVLTMLLVVVGNSAVSVWIVLGRFGPSGNVTTYADPSTITRQGDTVKMWSLGDSDKPVELKTPLDRFVGGGMGPHLSTKMLREYDCKAGRTRHLFLTMHSGNMGEGKVVFSQPSELPPGQWRQIKPGSSEVIGTGLEEALWKFACENTQQAPIEEQASSRTQASIKAGYMQRIGAKIRRFIVMPPNLQGNPQAEFVLMMLPSGHLLATKLTSSSGDFAYNNAVQRAIDRAQPLPMPEDPALMKDFREITITFSAKE